MGSRKSAVYLSATASISLLAILCFILAQLCFELRPRRNSRAQARIFNAWPAKCKGHQTIHHSNDRLSLYFGAELRLAVRLVA